MKSGYEVMGSATGTPMAALFNHACDPNVFFNSDPGDASQTVVARAVRAIEKDEAVSMPYCNINLPRANRACELYFNFLFDCACSRCQEDTCITGTDALQCAMVCGAGAVVGGRGCHGILLLPQPVYTRGTRVTNSTTQSVSCACNECSTVHLLQDLEVYVRSLYVGVCVFCFAYIRTVYNGIFTLST